MAPSKRGLGWPWDNPESAFSIYEPSIKNNHIEWLFNWEMWKPKGFPAGLDYTPQVRLGNQASTIDQFLTTLGVGKVGHFIGFNEPDIAAEANMSVADGVKLWKQYVLPAKGKFKFRLGSPAMSNGPNGKKWLQEFIQQLGGIEKAEIDFVVCHWYGTDLNNFKNYVEDMHKTFNKPVWVNEFAYSHLNANQQPTVQQVEGFMKDALKWLDAQGYVERYAWFGAKMDVGAMVGSANNLTGGGHLTDVGKIYTGA